MNTQTKRSGSTMWFRNKKARTDFFALYEHSGKAEWFLVPLRKESHGFYNRRERKWYWGQLARGYHESLHEDVKRLLMSNLLFRCCRLVRCDSKGEPVDAYSHTNVWFHEDNTLSVGFITRSEAALFKLIYKE